jgi:hypothetical protein
MTAIIAFSRGEPIIYWRFPVGMANRPGDQPCNEKVTSALLASPGSAPRGRHRLGRLWHGTIVSGSAAGGSYSSLVSRHLPTLHIARTLGQSETPKLSIALHFADQRDHPRCLVISPPSSGDVRTREALQKRPHGPEPDQLWAWWSGSSQDYALPIFDVTGPGVRVRDHGERERFSCLQLGYGSAL